jgi:uncharacterized protein (UPF0335 family)
MDPYEPDDSKVLTSGFLTDIIDKIKSIFDDIKDILNNIKDIN